jgi:hypothetical protein
MNDIDLLIMKTNMGKFVLRYLLPPDDVGFITFEVTINLYGKFKICNKCQLSQQNLFSMKQFFYMLINNSKNIDKDMEKISYMPWECGFQIDYIPSMNYLIPKKQNHCLGIAINIALGDSQENRIYRNYCGFFDFFPIATIENFLYQLELLIKKYY